MMRATAKRAAKINALINHKVMQLDEERAQEFHEELCTLWRGRCNRAYEWALNARQTRYEAQRTWEKLLKWLADPETVKTWDSNKRKYFIQTSKWCAEKHVRANRLEKEAEKAADAWYYRAVEELIRDF